MRAYLPSYGMTAPKSLKSALALLEKGAGTWRVFAGGTDLMVLFEAGKLSHDKFISLTHFSELKKIRVKTDHVDLGALVTFSDFQENPILQKEFPILCRSSSETGAWAIQNRGTFGGNIANASPAADSSPGLLVYEAWIELLSAHGARWVPYRDFHLGYKKTVIQSHEIIARIRLPRPRGAKTGHFFRKVGTRKAQAISKVCVAGLAISRGGKLVDLRVALGSVGPTAIRCSKTEYALGAAYARGLRGAEWIAAGKEALLSEISPIDDIRSQAEYRRQVSANLLGQFLEEAGKS